MKIDLYNIEGETRFRLLQDLEVSGYTVPAGFQSDGCSIPRIFWSYIQPLDARFVDVWVLHDFLYAQGIATRKQADDLMYRLLVQRGMSKAKARTVWLAVRACGGSHYNDRGDLGPV